MRLILTENGAMLSDIECERETIYVGSQESCGVHLPDSRVAAQQLVIYPETDGGWVVQQLHAENIVTVNGTTIRDKARLKTGDEIEICGFLIRAFPEHEIKSAGVEIGTSIKQLTRFARSQLPSGAVIKKPDESLTISNEHLHRIGQINLTLSQTIVIEELMTVALRTQLEVFSAQRIWMGIRRVNYGAMEYTEGRLLTGSTFDLPEIGKTVQPRVLDRGQFVLLPRISAKERFSVMAGPLVGPDGTLGMIYLDSGDSGRVFEEEDLDYFILTMNLFAVQLDAIFKHTARDRAAMIDGEVSVAHEIQARLTPRKLPQWDKLQFGAFREPGREHTGDVYDVVRLSNGMAAIMVAHTPAAGAMPSMLISQVQAGFRSAAMHMDAPHIFMRCMNWLLYDGQKDHPLECFMGIIDPDTGEMRYAIAGSPGVYIIGNRGDERPLRPTQPAPSLGLVKAAAFPTIPEQLESNETLVVFTPGVTTAKNRDGETFGEDRFVNILCDGFGQLASSMLKEMLTDLRNFTEGGSQPNDVTVLLAHRV